MNKIFTFTVSLFLFSSLVFSQVKEGISYMIIATHSNKALEIKPDADIAKNGLQLQQNDSTGADNQLFYFKRVKSGYYQIIAKCGGETLEIKKGSLKDHDTIQQNLFNGADNQLFTLVKSSNGAFAIINKNSGYGFDVLGGRNALGNDIAIIQYPSSGAPNQLFRMVEAGNIQAGTAEGLQKFPFLYAGEWQNSSFKDQKMYIVRDGQVVWTYTMPDGGEYGDATLLSNGNILFSRKTGATEITQDKKVVWNFDAPNNSEIHTCQPLGLDRVFMMQNDVPAKAMIINKKTGKIEKELIVPTAGRGNHGMFRHCRYTKDGTFLIAHMDMNKVVEYDSTGKVIWSFDALSPWAAIRLKNGNTLISGNHHGYVKEVDKQGNVVWEFNRNDVPNINIYTIQEVERLANGNTVISNWCAGALSGVETKGSVQFFEVTPDKKVVWILSEWDNPHLGPATSIQLLNEPGIPENGDLQR